MAVDEQRALVGVEAHIEQRLAVARPDDGAARIRNGVRQVLAGCQVADADREKLRPLVVDGIGQEFVVGAVRRRADLPIAPALGLLVAVEQDLLAAAPAPLPAQARILAAGDVAGEIFEGAVGSRHRAVVFLDARPHLGVERLLQRRRVGQGALGIGVLGLEVGADLRIERRGVAHHLLPVVGAQPGVFIHQLDAVMD